MLILKIQICRLQRLISKVPKVTNSFSYYPVICATLRWQTMNYGPLVLTTLIERVQNWRERNYNYKFVLNVETIGKYFLYK